MFSPFNRHFDGSVFFIYIFSSLCPCLLVCLVIEHLTKRSCNEDINFVHLHKNANMLGNYKSKYGNTKLTKADTNKEKSFLDFSESNSFRGLSFESCFQLDSAILFSNIEVSIDSKKCIKGLRNVSI